MKGGGVGYVIKSLTLKLPLFLKAEPPSDVVHRSRCCPSEGNDEHKGIDIEEGREEVRRRPKPRVDFGLSF